MLREIISKVRIPIKLPKKPSLLESKAAPAFFIIAISFMLFELITFFITFSGTSLFDRALMATVITSSSVAMFFNPSSFPPLHVHLSGLQSTGNAWKDDGKREERIIVNGFIMAYGYLLFSLIAGGIVFMAVSNLAVNRIAASLVSGAIAIIAIRKKFFPFKMSEKYWKKSISYMEKKPPFGVLMAGFGYSIIGLSTTCVFMAVASLISMGVGNASLLFSLLSIGLLISMLIMGASLVLIYDEEKMRLLALNCDAIRSGALWTSLISSLALLLSAT